MLTFEINSSDLRQPARISSIGLNWENSFINPIIHPMLESFVVESSTKTALVVRERGRYPVQNKRVSSQDFDEALAVIQNWPLQCTVIVLDHKLASLCLFQGKWGTAPIYLVEHGDTLHGHWDPRLLYPLLSEVDLVRAAKFLQSFDMPYGCSTLFSELKMLSVNAKVIWGEENNLKIQYPQANKRPSPKSLRSGAKPVETAVSILEQSVQRWIHPNVNYGAELSGGLDSSLVAITVQNYYRSLKTYGIVLDDAVGQEKRYSDLISQFGFENETVNLNEFLPFSPESKRWTTALSVPWEETYEEAVEGLLEKAQSQGVQAIFTGFGGDELCPLYFGEDAPPPELLPFEAASESPFTVDFLTDSASNALRHFKADAAPQMLVDASSLETAAFGSALYLRHGLWPIHPLCTPELVWFCGSLPWDWRVGRTIERQMLQRKKCPESVYACRTVDSFLFSLAQGLRKNSFDKLMKLFHKPLVAELGIVDSDRLRQSFQNWRVSGSDEAAVSFYSVASLEMALKKVLVYS